MSMTRSKPAHRNSAVKSYRRRVRTSHCRGKNRRSCSRSQSCKRARGPKRTFCRKRKNTKRNM